MPTQYKASRYGYKSWLIAQRVYNKKQGTWRWEAIKYPGRLVDLLDAMVDLGFGNATIHDIQEIKDKLDTIEQLLIETVRGADCVEFEGA